MFKQPHPFTADESWLAFYLSKNDGHSFEAILFSCLKRETLSSAMLDSCTECQKVLSLL